ncbi:MAG: CaiB/BaiF CoA transferase family protein, partial [Dehalococcoidia bacterium]
VPESREVFHRLVRVSDGVFNNLRGDQPRKLGLDYEALKEVNPRVVCCSLSGFGTSGSKAAQPSYDYIIQGLTGLQWITGDPGTPPTKAGISVIDFASGFAAAMALLAGVHQAQRTGQGCDLDVSLFDVSVSMMNYLAAWHLNQGYIPEKMPDSAHPSLVPSQNFPTKDSYIVVMCNKEGFWVRLCQGLGLSELLEDERFKDFEGRFQHREVLLPLLKERFRQETTAHWLEHLKGAGVPCGPIRTFSECFSDPFLKERDMIWELDSPVWGRIKVTGCPVKVAGTSSPQRAAPRLGEDTVTILGEMLGYSLEEIEALRQKGAV